MEPHIIPIHDFGEIDGPLNGDGAAAVAAQMATEGFKAMSVTLDVANQASAEAMAEPWDEIEPAQSLASAPRAAWMRCAIPGARRTTPSEPTYWITPR